MLFWIIATVYFFIATVFFARISRNQVYIADDQLLLCSWIISVCWVLFLIVLMIYSIYFYTKKLLKKIKKNE